MKRTKLIALVGSVSLALVLAVLPFMTACPAPAEEEEAPPEEEEELPSVNWRMTSQMHITGEEWLEKYGMKKEPDSLPDISSWDDAININRIVEKKTNGKFTIDPYSGGMLCKAEEIYPLVKAGVIDCAISYGAYWSGRQPIGMIDTNIWWSAQGFEDAYDLWQNTELQQIIRDAYAEDGIFYIGSLAAGGQSFQTNFPINSLEDLEGKKLRGAGATAKFMEALGIVPVPLPPLDQYTALERGTIDGTVFGTINLPIWGIEEVVTYVYGPEPLYPCATSYIANLDAWNSLPKEYQDIFLETLHEWNDWNLKVKLPTIESKVKEMAIKRGLQWEDWSPEMVAKARLRCLPVWDEIAALSPWNARAIALIKKHAGVE